jgi:hypothetical protein
LKIQDFSFIEKKNMAPLPPPKKLSGAQNLKRKRQKQDETEKAAKSLAKFLKVKLPESSELVLHATEEDPFNKCSLNEAPGDKEQHTHRLQLKILQKRIYQTYHRLCCYKPVSDSSEAGLTGVFIDEIVQEFDSDMNDCRGQGVQTRILNQYPRSFLNPCGCHTRVV